MRLPRGLASAGLAAACLLAPWPGPASAQTSVYRLTRVVILPKAPASFDLSWADAGMRRYFLSDRTNNAIDVVDADSGELAALIPGFAGATGRPPTSGPNGLVSVPERNELWVGDGDSTVKVVDLAAGAVVAAIPTGGTARTDQQTYVAAQHLVVANNNAEQPPFLTFISTETRTVLGRLPFPEAEGLEGAVWDAASGMVYQAVEASKANPGGEIAVIDPASRQIVKTYPLEDCGPHSLAVGPNGQMLVGCSGGAKLRTLVITTRGDAVATVPQVGGADQVWYNAGDNHYYLAANRMTADGTKTGALTPMLGIIDAGTNTWLANLPTVPGAHSLAVDSRTNRAFVPLNNVGIGIYAASGGGK